MRAQDTLFADEAPAAAPGAPLAERLRPQTLDDVVGQRHLLAPGGRCAWPSNPGGCRR